MTRLHLYSLALSFVACLLLASPQFAQAQGIRFGWGLSDRSDSEEHDSDDHSRSPHWSDFIPRPVVPYREPHRTYYPDSRYPDSRYYPEPRYNVLPTPQPQPEPAVQPLPNEVVVPVPPNNFMDQLNIKKLTREELTVFKDQIQKKTDELGGELESIVGKDAGVEGLVDLAKQGKLDANAVKDFVSKAGGLSMADQMKATQALKGLIFNNGALGAVNFALVNFNVNINVAPMINVNVNVVNIGGGWWPGFWGFPNWPWAGPAWLGPGIWWGPIGYFPGPYYFPNANGADAAGLPYSIAGPVPDYDGDVVRSGILITNAGEGPVNYTLDRQQFTMQPGYRQTIPKTKATVAFNRGGNFGTARYQIGDDWYEFMPTERGWDLFRQTARVTLDNAGNPFAFRYVLDNRQMTLAAGSQAQHAGKYPLPLRFDNGRGQTLQKMLTKGSYRVAVGGDGLLDVFDADDVIPPAPLAELAMTRNEETKNLFANPDKIPSLFGPSPQTTPAAVPQDTSPTMPDLFGSTKG